MDDDETEIFEEFRLAYRISNGIQGSLKHFSYKEGLPDITHSSLAISGDSSSHSSLAVPSEAVIPPQTIMIRLWSPLFVVVACSHSPLYRLVRYLVSTYPMPIDYQPRILHFFSPVPDEAGRPPREEVKLFLGRPIRYDSISVPSLLQF